MLHFVNNQAFKALFGKPADGLEQSTEDEDEYRILDRQPVTNRFANLGGKSAAAAGNYSNCAAYVAGVVEGLLCAAKLHCRVAAHPYVEEEGEGDRETTIYVIKFAKEVTARDRQIS